MASNPFPASPVVPETFGADREIRFRCRKGIACWNACCSNIDIALTPYDALRLEHRLGVGSAAFLREYTVPYEMEKDSIAGVKLKPVEGGTACRFMKAEGCAVYEDRPTACRYYPVALLSMRRQGESTDTDSYALVKEPHCLGHQEPRTLTVGEYRREQGLEEYDELARGWRQLVLKKKSSGPMVGKPSKRSLELFFMACYDLDRFREFVSSDAFASLYDLPQAEIRETLALDTRLMLFAFRFLRQVLFGEVTIATRADAVQERAHRLRERAMALEREAAQRLADDEDDAQPAFE
ncbi:MAG TPA: YkgJ family cysteine cluster protein [Usitatibacter sp.]